MDEGQYRKLCYLLERIAVALEGGAAPKVDPPAPEFNLRWEPDDTGPMLSYGIPAMRGQIMNRPLRSINGYWYCACQCVNCRNCKGYSDA